MGFKINPWFHSPALVVPTVLAQLRSQEGCRGHEDAKMFPNSTQNYKFRRIRHQPAKDADIFDNNNPPSTTKEKTVDGDSVHSSCGAFVTQERLVRAICYTDPYIYLHSILFSHYFKDGIY